MTGTSTMTNKELLELSATAAGIKELTWREGSQCFYYDDDETGRECWEPLDNDRQAFKLAVDLGIAITPYPIYAMPKHSVIAKRYKNGIMREVNATECLEIYCDDKYAATRRAIVRSAAAIGSLQP